MRTHIRTSSTAKLQSVAKFSIVDGTRSNSLVSARGNGKSYCPNARWASAPTMPPTVIPTIAGAIRPERLAIIAAIGSPSVSASSSRCDSDVASSVKSGRKSFRVRRAHSERVVVRISVSRPPTFVSRPLTSRTCMSATLAKSL